MRSSWAGNLRLARWETIVCGWDSNDDRRRWQLGRTTVLKSLVDSEAANLRK